MDNLEDEMMRLVNRYTIGASKPVAILLHTSDYLELWNRYHIPGTWEMSFNGVECRIDNTAPPGEPLAIVRS